MNPSRRNSKGKTVSQPRNSDSARPSLTEWLAVKLDLPADAMDGGIRLDLRGRNTLLVHGCTRILDFSPCEIRLLLGTSTLVVGGKRLICTSSLAGAVGIEGYICSVCFCDREVEP